jgi:recombination protein RecT
MAEKEKRQKGNCTVNALAVKKTAVDVLNNKQESTRNRANAFLHILDTQDLEKVLPQGVSYDKFKSIARVALQDNPTLMDCETRGLVNCFVQVAVAGLDSYSPSRREAWIVPMGMTAEVHIGYQGFKKMALRQPNVASIESRCVYENELYEVDFMNKQQPIIHKGTRKPKGELTDVYCLITLKNGDVYLETMDKGQVDAVRACAKTQNVWSKHYDEMARKTVIKRALKHFNNSLSESMLNAIALDDQGYTEPKKLTADVDTGLLYADPDDQPSIMDSLGDVDTSNSPLNQPIATPQATQPTQPTLLDVEVVK